MAKRLIDTSSNDKLALESDLNIIQDKSTVFITDPELSIEDQKSDLKVLKVTHDQYRDYINTYTREQLKNYVFVLISDVEDVFGKRIANVADPIQDNDSANKKYVDELINDIDQKIGQINSALDTINGEIA